MRILIWVGLAFAVSWACVAVVPELWPVALFGFVQNVAFTFVSRGRNSGHLGYHLVAAVFSNGIYAVLLLFSIKLVATAGAAIGPFLVCYTCSTLAGSVFAHWLAVRVEHGRARNVQEDRIELIEARIDALDKEGR